MAVPVTVALLVAGCFMFSATTRAAVSGDNVDISKLLAEAKAEAVELRNDSAAQQAGFARNCDRGGERLP
jgi:hypothetical protein